MKSEATRLAVVLVVLLVALTAFVAAIGGKGALIPLPAIIYAIARLVSVVVKK